MSKHKANVDSNDTRYTKKCTSNTILIFDDITGWAKKTDLFER